jgi:hypothetical protein
MYNIATPTK